MAVRVGINGFGRVGRNLLRATMDDSEIAFVAVNDIADPECLAHLLKYDSTHGALDADISCKEDAITVNGREIKVLAEREPGNLPWKDLGVKIAIEATGQFRKRELASKHLTAGAKKVIISAAAEGADVTIVLGVNQERYDGHKHHIISNASCTTNCLAPVAKVLLDSFGIKRGFVTTIHSYTTEQNLLDAPQHSNDMRRARAAAVSMIPTTTGAAKAIGVVLPELAGKMDGIAVRVPTPNVSLLDLVAQLEKDASVEDVNAAMKEAAEGYMKGIIQYVDVPLVSVDFNGNPHSAIFDSLQTMALEGGFVKILAWYDNEWGYSSRLRDLIKYIALSRF